MVLQPSHFTRNPHIDNIKTLLIFLVVIGHFADYITENSNLSKSLFLFIYSFHMPLFIFLNGYLSNNIFDNHNRLIEKINGYLMLYVCMKISMFFLRHFFLKENIGFDLDTESGVPWYLFALSAYYFITEKIRLFNRKWVLLFSILFSLTCGYDKGIGDFLVLSRIIVFFPFFIMGYTVREQEISLPDYRKIGLPGGG